MNPSHRSSHSPQAIIRRIPARSGGFPAGPSLARRIERLAARIGVTALIALAVLVGLRLLGLLLFRAEIAEGMGEVARVGGFGSRVTEWLTGPVSLIFGLAFFSFLVRLSLAFFLPAVIGGGRIWGPAAAILCLTGFSALVPEAIKSMRGVDDTGRPVRMTEVDPADVVWFGPEGDARIFYADHIDGKRRFYGRPGHTPFDQAMAFPVTEEVRRAWLEEARLEKERERIGEERRAAEADLETRRRELREWQENRGTAGQISIEQAEALLGGEPGRTESTAPTTAAPTMASRPPEPEPVLLDLRAGKTLALETSGRAVECWSNGSAQFWTGTSGDSRPVVGPMQKRHFEREGQLYVKPVNASSTRLYVRWRDGGPAGPPVARFLAEEPAARATPAPWSPPVAAAPNLPRVQAFPLIRGKVFHLPVMGDTVECWSDGPIVIAGSAPKATQQSLSPGQRIRIGGSDTIHAAPNGPGATRLFVQPVSPNLDRFRQAPSSSSSSADLRRRLIGF